MAHEFNPWGHWIHLHFFVSLDWGDIDYIVALLDDVAKELEDGELKDRLLDARNKIYDARENDDV